MKTRNTFSAAAIVAVMTCSAAHAQVLGGNVGGALNGTLGGGLRDSSVLTHGGADGSFGGELDTGSMLHKTRGAADETTRRARNVGTNVRNRTESTAASARDKSATAASSAASTAHAAKDSTVSKLDAASLSTGADGNASASRKGLVAEAAADANGAAGIDAKKDVQQDAPESTNTDVKRDTSKQ